MFLLSEHGRQTQFVAFAFWT